MDQFNDPDTIFEPALVGNQAQKITFSDTGTISNTCRLADLKEFCGSLIITFIDTKTNEVISTFPYKGLILKENPYELILNPTGDDDLGEHSVTMAIQL